MTTFALRTSLLALAALLSACGESLPPTRAEAPPVTPVDPDLPLPPKMRCAPVAGATVARVAADCRRATEAQS